MNRFKLSFVSSKNTTLPLSLAYKSSKNTALPLEPAYKSSKNTALPLEPAYKSSKTRTFHGSMIDKVHTAKAGCSSCGKNVV